MAYKVEEQVQEDYVLLTVKGDEFELESWIDAISRVITLCSEESKTKLLIEDFVQDDFSLHEMENLINRLSGLGFLSLKTSVYVANPKRQFTNYFGEGIANRHGLDLKVFLNRDSAIDWLSDS